MWPGLGWHGIEPHAPPVRLQRGGPVLPARPALLRQRRGPLRPARHALGCADAMWPRGGTQTRADQTSAVLMTLLKGSRNGHRRAPYIARDAEYQAPGSAPFPG